MHMKTETQIAAFWDSAELESQEQVAICSGISRNNLGSFAPLYTYWQYCNKRSKNRLRPVIEKTMEENGKTPCPKAKKALTTKIQQLI